MDREHSQVNSLLAEAANLIRREKEAAGNVEPTEGYKRRQVEELKLFATQHDLWININSLPLSYLTLVRVEKMKYSQVMKMLYSS